MNKFEIWDNWSTCGLNYNRENNLYIWNHNKGCIDINYLVYLLNKDKNNDDKIELIKTWKSYEPLEAKINENVKTVQMNDKYINITDKQFKQNDIIILKSSTGTGKTTATANAIYKYNNDVSNKENNKKVLSIVSKISLTSQHIKSFSDANIKLVSYQDDTKEIDNDNISICINSILMFKNTPEEEFNDYIVYIDEIASFLKDLTHNETLLPRLKMCFIILMRIIKNCFKLIVSDAVINDNVFNFISSKMNNKTLYINNAFKKYEGVKAYRCREEQRIINELIEHTKASNYYLCASDSCKTITMLYLECLKNAKEEDKDKFILITSKNKFHIYDASTQFKNKFVFYSPSIIFGVDFSIFEKQDVFIYNMGRTLDPASLFQQTTRTRNINNLYYYSEIKEQATKFKTLDECTKFYNDISTTSKEINEVCLILDETDKEKIEENAFFKLFVYNEYVNDIYSTNKSIHYELILKDAGFDVVELGNIKNNIAYDKTELKEQIKQISEDKINKLIEDGTTDDTDLKTNLKVLNIKMNDSETVEKFKDVIMDEFKLKEHLNIIKLVKDRQFINFKKMEAEQNSYNVVNLNSSTYHKISLLLDLEQNLNIKQRLKVNTNIDDINFFIIPEARYNLIKKVFRIGRAKPKDKKELLQLYISIIKHITTNELIKTTRGTTREQKITYELNNELLKYNIELNSFSNKYYKNIDDSILKLLDIERPERPQNEINDPFNDDSLLDIDVDKNDYTFNKTSKKWIIDHNAPKLKDIR